MPEMKKRGTAFTLRKFVRTNREQLTQYVRERGIRVPLTERDLECWVLNDEHLYRWALSEGCKL